MAFHPFIGVARHKYHEKRTFTISSSVALLEIPRSWYKLPCSTIRQGPGHVRKVRGSIAPVPFLIMPQEKEYQPSPERQQLLQQLEQLPQSVINWMLERIENLLEQIKKSLGPLEIPPKTAISAARSKIKEIRDKINSAFASRVEDSGVTRFEVAQQICTVFLEELDDIYSNLRKLKMLLFRPKDHIIAAVDGSIQFVQFIQEFLLIAQEGLLQASFPSFAKFKELKRMGQEAVTRFVQKGFGLLYTLCDSDVLIIRRFSAFLLALVTAIDVNQMLASDGLRRIVQLSVVDDKIIQLAMVMALWRTALVDEYYEQCKGYITQLKNDNDVEVRGAVALALKLLKVEAKKDDICANLEDQCDFDILSTSVAPPRNYRESNKLVIEVCEARSLKPKDGNTALGRIAEGKGGSSDPYVKIRYGTQKQKTKVQMSTTNPTFEEEFWFAPTNMLRVICYDHDKVGANDMIGSALIDLRPLRNGNALRNWFELFNDQDESAGFVDVGLQCTGNQLTVTAFGGRDLTAMDANGTSDPYLELRLLSEKSKTKVAKKTLNPVWNESFGMVCNLSSADFYFEVKDFDKTSSNDFLCATTVPADELLSKTDEMRWFELLDADGGNGGEISLRVSYRKDKLSLVILGCRNLPAADSAGLKDVLAAAGELKGKVKKKFKKATRAHGSHEDETPSPGTNVLPGFMDYRFPVDISPEHGLRESAYRPDGLESAAPPSTTGSGAEIPVTCNGSVLMTDTGLPWTVVGKDETPAAGTSDPLVVVRYHHQRMLSQPQMRTLNPIFNWRTVVELENAPHVVMATIYDFDKYSFSDALGTVSIDFTRIQNVGQLLAFPLKDRKGEAAGTVDMRLDFDGTMFNVQVAGARGLRGADSNNMSDPFCVLRLGRDKRKTIVQKKTLTPVWNETFVFDVTDKVAVTLYDYDRTSKNDLLGTLNLTLRYLPHYVTIHQWYPLHDAKVPSNTAQDFGFVRLRMMYCPAMVMTVDGAPVAGSPLMLSPRNTFASNQIWLLDEKSNQLVLREYPQLAVTVEGDRVVLKERSGSQDKNQVWSLSPTDVLANEKPTIVDKEASIAGDIKKVLAPPSLPGFGSSKKREQSEIVAATKSKADVLTCNIADLALPLQGTVVSVGPRVDSLPLQQKWRLSEHGYVESYCGAYLPNVMMVGEVKIGILKARGLNATDPTLKSDPYCACYFTCSDDAFKTKKISSTLTPEWNHTEIVKLPSYGEKYMVVEVWDHNKLGPDKLISQCRVLLGVGLHSEFAEDKEHTAWYPLMRRKQGETGMQRHLRSFWTNREFDAEGGEIRLSFLYHRFA